MNLRMLLLILTSLSPLATIHADELADILRQTVQKQVSVTSEISIGATGATIGGIIGFICAVKILSAILPQPKSKFRSGCAAGYYASLIPGNPLDGLAEAFVISTILPIGTGIGIIGGAISEAILLGYSRKQICSCLAGIAEIISSK